MPIVDPELLKIMCCPETHQTLREADTAAVAKMNEQISAGTVKNRGGVVVTAKITGGLIREDGKFLYPVREHPIMLVNEALPLPS